jgi:hypothetical protein
MTPSTCPRSSRPRAIPCPKPLKSLAIGLRTQGLSSGYEPRERVCGKRSASRCLRLCYLQQNRQALLKSAEPMVDPVAPFSNRNRGDFLARGVRAVLWALVRPKPERAFIVTHARPLPRLAAQALLGGEGARRRSLCRLGSRSWSRPTRDRRRGRSRRSAGVGPRGGRQRLRPLGRVVDVEALGGPLAGGPRREAARRGGKTRPGGGLRRSRGPAKRGVPSAGYNMPPRLSLGHRGPP